jgi:transcriptional regulator with XRE-family HTH domain
MTAAQKKRITTEIRNAIERSGISRYEIAKRSGVSQGVLSRFVNEKGSLTLDAIEALAPLLGITITAGAKKKGSTR